MDDEREHPNQEAASRVQHPPGVSGVETTPVPVTPGRWTSAPRRRFPPLDPVREAILRELKEVALAAEPRLAVLERRLLAMDGTAVLLAVEPDLDELLGRGRAFPGANVLNGPMRSSDSRLNAALLHVVTGGRARIASGYALSGNGLWRRWSWNLDVASGRALEPTRSRLSYFGYALDDAEVGRFLRDVEGSGDLRPDDVEAVRRFLEREPSTRAESIGVVLRYQRKVDAGRGCGRRSRRRGPVPTLPRDQKLQVHEVYRRSGRGKDVRWFRPIGSSRVAFPIRDHDATLFRKRHCGQTRPPIGKSG